MYPQKSQFSKIVEDIIERLYRSIDILPDTPGDVVLYPAMDKLVKQYFDTYRIPYVTCSVCQNLTARDLALLNRDNVWVGRCCELPNYKERDKRYRKGHRRNR